MLKYKVTFIDDCIKINQPTKKKCLNLKCNYFLFFIEYETNIMWPFLNYQIWTNKYTKLYLDYNYYFWKILSFAIIILELIYDNILIAWFIIFYV